MHECLYPGTSVTPSGFEDSLNRPLNMAAMTLLLVVKMHLCADITVSIKCKLLISNYDGHNDTSTIE